VKFFKTILITTIYLAFNSLPAQTTYVVDEEFSTVNTLNRGKIFDFVVDENGNIVIMSDMINANTNAWDYCRIDSEGNLVDNFADIWYPGLKSYLDGFLFYGFSSISRTSGDGQGYDYYEYTYTTFEYYHPLSQVHDAQVLPDKTFLAGGWINVDSVSPGAPGSFRCMLKLDSTGTAVPGYPEFTCTAPEEFSYTDTYIHTLDTTSTGDIIAGGTFTAINGVETNHIARISQDGEVDPTFSTPLADEGSTIVLLVDSQDRIWFVPIYGATLEGVEGTPMLIRLLPNGELDESYSHPYLEEDRIMFPPMESYPSGVTELPDGTFIITGFMNEAEDYTCKTIVHIDDSGNIIDDFWLQTGPAEANWDGYIKDHFTSDTHITEDGKIYIAGQFSEFNGFETSSIVRLRPSELSTEQADQESFKIYPNPASEHITISYNGTERAEVRILDMQGKLVLGQTVYNNIEIDINSFRKGVYVVHLISDDGKVLTQRLIKY